MVSAIQLKSAVEERILGDDNWPIWALSTCYQARSMFLQDKLAV